MSYEHEQLFLLLILLTMIKASFAGVCKTVYVSLLLISEYLDPPLHLLQNTLEQVANYCCHIGHKFKL